MVTTAQVPVGTVSSLKGNVSVIPATGGPARPLQVGDVIHPGDRIISAAGAQIQVKDPEGKLWSPRDNAALNTTTADDAAAGVKPDTGTAKAKTAATVVGGDNLDDVIAAVNTGNEEDATAAGLAGGGGGGTLGEGLRVDRVTEVVSAQEFNYGTGDRTQAQDAETAVPLVDVNDAPVITDTPTDPDRPTTSFDPVTGNYNVTTPEDTPVSGQVKATDADGDPLTYTLGGTSPAHGTVVVNADGTWTYTPNKDYNGSDAFTVVVSDGRGGTAVSTVTIGIIPVNDPPVFTDPDVPGQDFDPTTVTYKAATSEDTTVVGKVAATDLDGDTLTFTLGSTTPAHGTVVVAADGSYTYTPSKDYAGSDSFTVVVDDGNGGKVTSTVTVNIAPVADIPLVTVSLGKASPDVVTINKDNATTTDHGFKVTAINFDGTTGTVSTVSGGNVSGFGVAGSVSEDTGNDGQPSELGYDGATKQSEKLSIAFDHPASSATVQFSWLSPTEHATYTLYDANGNVIGSGVVTGVTDQIDPAITLKADNGAAISRIDFGAAGARDDYVIHNVTYVRSESIPITVTATPTDIDHSEHVSALVISVPGDATLSAGTKNPDGTWTLPLSSNGDYQVVIDPVTHAVTVTGLVMTLPSDHAGDIKVTVTATVYDTVTNVTAQGTGSAENNVPELTDPDVPGQSFDPATGNYKVTTDEDTPVSGQVKATDADGDTLTYSLGTKSPANGTVVVNADGTWTYTPNKNYNGSDSFTVLVDDGHGGKATSTVTIGVTPVNDPPKPEDPTDPNFDPATGTYSVTTPEDTPVKGQVKATDADGDTLTFTLGGTTPAHGTVVVNTDGTWTYTPNKDYNGADSFTVLVDDGHGGTAISTVKVGITPVNDAPVAVNDSTTTPEDRAVVIDVRANDKDVDGDTLTVTQINGQPLSATQSVTLAGQGVVSLNADGSLTFTPQPDYNGQVKFAYTVQDPAGTTSTADVTVDVTPLSDTPVAVNDTATTPEDTPVKIDVLANDTDADGDTLSITAINGQPISLTQPVTLAGQGVVSLNADGTLTFNPAANYHGKVEFTYTVTDGQTPLNGNVTVDVTSVNDAPVAADDRVTTPEDQPIEIDVRGNDRDADGDALTVSAVTQPGHGTVTINPVTGNPVYTPAPDYNGTDTFTYTVRDPSGATSQATVTVTVGAVNDAPQAQADVGATDQNGTLTVSAADGVIQSGDQPAGRDSDPDGDTLAVSAVSHGSTAGQVGQPLAGAFGTLTLHADGSYTYVPNDAAKALGQGATGQDVFSYTVKDAGGLSSSTTLTLTVTGTNDAPVAVADRATTPEDTPVVIRVLDNDSDVDGDKLTITQIAGQKVSSGGDVAIKDSTGTQIATVKLNADGTLTLTPANDYNGPVNFNYTVSDGKGGTDTASVNVVVDDVNDAPIADLDVVSGLEDTPFTFDPRANDTDPDGDPLTITQINGQPISTTQSVALPQGTLKLNADGTLTFSPAPNYNGKLSFDYTVSDGKGGTDTATVNMTVKAVNDPPVITDTPTDPNLPGGGNGFDPKTGNYNVTTPEDTPVKGQVKATDVDGDTLTFSLGNKSPSNGSVVVNADGTWTYTPNKDYNGSDSFTVTVSDGKGGTATSTVTIGVTPENDPPKPEDPTDPNFDPVTATYSVTTPEDTPVKGQVKATDVDGDPLTFTLGGTAPAHGTVVVNADGTWLYTPGKDYNGNDVFTVTISDGHGGTATSTVKIGVTPVNDNPTANPDQVTVAEDSVITFDPRSNDSDVDGDSLIITAVNGQPISTATPVVLPEGTISLNGNGTLTFTPAPNYNGTLSLTYTVSDGHDGTATAPITIDVTPVDNVAVVGSGSVSLSEEGLAGGIADNTGSPDTTNATSASGKLTVTDIDGGINTLTLSGPSGLTSGGAAITWSGKGTVDNPLVGSASGKTIITASIDSNGNYQVSLQGPVDHANPNVEDVRSIQLTVQASNGTATSTGTLTLNIEDDSPASGNQTQYVSPATQSTNVMLVVDVSGSMKNALADTTVNGLKATIKGLLDHYGELGDVRVQIVTFSDSASARATWMTLADAKTFVDKLSANGGTNYDAALASAQSGFNASGKLAGAVNVSYFFSDGEPTQGREVDNGSDKTKWESFLKANDIDSYAMGINGASSSNLKYLEPIAYNGASETERPAVILTSNTAVKTYLDNSVVTVEHGSLASLAGADGLKAVTAFSAANQTSSTYNAATGIQTITLSSGSRIELNLATGEYTYTRPAGNTGDTFSYTIVDKDGDKGSGTLTLTTVNHAPDGTNGTVSLAEDTSYHLQVSDFGFKDSDAGDRLSAVRIDTLPTDGTLTLGGKAVVAGQVIAAGDIGSLVFKPDANENGATYAKMTFSVADRAGAYDTTPNTLTFNVTPVNDAPIARIASHGGLLGLVDVSVDPILNFSSHQHLGVYDVDNNLTRIDVSVKNLLSVGGLANDILGLIGLGGDHSKLTIDTALAQSYGFTISGNDTRHIVITSATAGGTVDYGLVNKLLATLTYDPAELLGISADLLPKMTIKATDAFGLSSTDTASAGLISVHVDTVQHVLDTKVDVSVSAAVDSAVTLTHDALTGEFTHAIDVGLTVSTPLTLTGHSASSDVFAWSLSDHGTASASTGTNGTTLNATHAVDTIVDFDTAARSAGGDVLDLRDLLSGEHTVGGTGNLSQFLDFDTTSNPGSTIVHVSSTGGFTAGYDAKAEDQTIVLQNVNLRGDLGLGASASDNQVIAELMTRGKLLVDNH